MKLLMLLLLTGAAVFLTFEDDYAFKPTEIPYQHHARKKSTNQSINFEQVDKLPDSDFSKSPRLEEPSNGFSFLGISEDDQPEENNNYNSKEVEELPGFLKLKPELNHENENRSSNFEQIDEVLQISKRNEHFQKPFEQGRHHKKLISNSSSKSDNEDEDFVEFNIDEKFEVFGSPVSLIQKGWDSIYNGLATNALSSISLIYASSRSCTKNESQREFKLVFRINTDRESSQYYAILANFNGNTFIVEKFLSTLILSDIGILFGISNIEDTKEFEISASLKDIFLKKSVHYKNSVAEANGSRIQGHSDIKSMIASAVTEAQDTLFEVFDHRLKNEPEHSGKSKAGKAAKKHINISHRYDSDFN
jgi:hypothetical protein